MIRSVVLSLLLIVSTTGCAMFSGARALTVKTSCSPEQVWEATLAGMGGLTLHTKDKENAEIVTEWANLESAQLAGVFQRAANRERARFFVNLKPDGETVTVSVYQAREYFSPMGVRSQSTRWKRIPPLAEEEQRLIQRLSTSLKENGCAILR